jgi:hypothetical protein
VWRAAQLGFEDDVARAWAEVERERCASIEWVAIQVESDGRIMFLEGRRRSRVNDDDGGSFHSRLEAHLRTRQQSPTPAVLRYAAMHGLVVEQLRW